MATTLKNLGQAAPIATTPTVLYTVPALTQTVCSSILVCNRSNTSSTFRVSHAVGGGTTQNKDYLYYDVTIAGNATFAATLGITMSSGDKLTVYSTTADLSFNLYGQENS